MACAALGRRRSRPGPGAGGAGLYLIWRAAHSAAQDRVVRVVRLGPRDGIDINAQLRLEEALYRGSRHETEVGWLVLNHPGAAQRPTVVLGFSGKIDKLVDEEQRARAGAGLLRRFSGGGTVVVDRSTVFASWLLSTALLPHVKPFPKPIMAWSGDFYAAAFRRAGLAALQLRADDYVVGDLKVAGNAQAISGDRWLHHTSFLYDFDDQLMRVLRKPPKQPEYRADREHDAFLRRLKTALPRDVHSEADPDAGPRSVLDAFETEALDHFASLGVRVERASWNDALAYAAARPSERQATRWEVEPPSEPPTSAQ